MARLTRVSGAAPAFPLTVGDKLTLGRSPDNDVVVADVAVSRRHARIVRQATGYRLVDLGSENGTWVEGRRVREYWLQDGDRIGIGETLLEFTLDPGEAVSAAAPRVLSVALATLAALCALAMTAGLSALLWHYWPRSASDPARAENAAPDCYDVCFRRCRALGDRTFGPWCNDPSCCRRACVSLHGIGDDTLGYRECQERQGATAKPLP